MRRVRWRLGMILVTAVLGLGILVNAQPKAAGEAVRLLIVDETKTFLSTMRVGGLVGVLKGSGLFRVDVIFADVESSWDDPLAGKGPDPDLEPYDLVLLIPRGIDDGSIDWICSLSGDPRLLPTRVSAGIEFIAEVVGQVFEGSVRPIGVHDDLLLDLFYEVYLMKGWIR